MSRTKDYYMWEEEAYREEHDIPDDAEVDPETLAGPMRPFEWFADNLAREALDQPAYEWDVFVSYASERRTELVVPLVSALDELGVSLWFDQHHEFKYADRAINPALPASRVGVAVISPEYLPKTWTVYELDAFLDVGTPAIVILTYALAERAVHVMRQWALAQPANSAAITVIELKSARVRGAARRIRAAVRHVGANPRRTVEDRTGAQSVKGLAHEYQLTLPSQTRPTRLLPEHWNEDQEEDFLSAFSPEERDQIMGHVPEDDRYEW